MKSTINSLFSSNLESNKNQRCELHNSPLPCIMCPRSAMVPAKDVEDIVAYEKKKKSSSKSYRGIRLGPFTNPNTFDKDMERVLTYGRPLLDFFSGYFSSYPMFIDTSEPKALKKGTLEFEVACNVDGTGYLVGYPFANENIGFYFAQAGSFVQMKSFESLVQNYDRYRVVAAKMTVKQIGVYELSNYMGAVYDAYIAPTTVDVRAHPELLPSMQLPDRSRKMGVNGLSGVTICSVNSPFTPMYRPDGHESPFTRSAWMQVTGVDGIEPLTLPPFTIIRATCVQGGGQLSLRSALGTDLNITYGDAQMPQSTTVGIGHAGFSGTNNVSFDFSEPVGPVFVLKILGNKDTRHRVIVELALEGTLKPESMTDMPMITPAQVYSQEKLNQAIINVFPMIITNQEKMGMQAFYEPPKFKGGKVKKTQEEGANNYIEVLTKKGKDLITQKLQGEVVHQNIENVINGDTKTLHASQNVKDLKDKVDKIKLAEGYKPAYKAKVVAKKGPIVGYIPKYIENAALFAEMNIAMLSQSEVTGRLFRSASLELPRTSFQFFPAVADDDPDKVIPCVVVVKVGRDRSCETKSDTIDVLNYEGEKRSITFFYHAEDFANEDGENSFLLALTYCAQILYGQNFQYCEKKELSIRMFGPKPFADSTSYTAALLAALTGGPSGALWTGVLDKDEKNNIYSPPMDAETVKKKATIATPLCPLYVMGQTTLHMPITNAFSGIVPVVDEGRLIVGPGPENLLLQAVMSFKLRQITNTPIQIYSQAISNLFVEKFENGPTLFILASNTGSREVLDHIARNGKPMSYHQIRRANPDNFRPYYVKDNVLYDATTFFELNRQALMEQKGIWKVTIGGMIFVEPNTLRGLCSMYKYKGEPAPDTDGLNTKYGDAISALYAISIDEAKKEAKTRLDNTIDNAFSLQKKGIIAHNDELSRMVEMKNIELDSKLQPYANRLAALLDILNRFQRVVGTGSLKMSSVGEVGQFLYNVGIANSLKDGLGYKANLKYFEEMLNPQNNTLYAPLHLARLGGVNITSNIRQPRAEEKQKLLDFLENNPMPGIEEICLKGDKTFMPGADANLPPVPVKGRGMWNQPKQQPQQPPLFQPPPLPPQPMNVFSQIPPLNAPTSNTINPSPVRPYVPLPPPQNLPVRSEEINTDTLPNTDANEEDFDAIIQNKYRNLY